jgi:hypothetical protein
VFTFIFSTYFVSGTQKWIHNFGEIIKTEKGEKNEYLCNVFAEWEKTLA